MKYGVRVGEKPVKLAKPYKKETKISPIKILNPDVRVPVQVSSGAHLLGVALPHNDTRDALSLAVGGLNRVCTQLKPPRTDTHAQFVEFSRDLLSKTFTPLSSDFTVDHKAWLMSRPYSLKKKLSMWAEWEKCFGQLADERDFVFGAFSKDEDYVKWSWNRLINAPSDVTKIFFGPIITAIEEQVYNSPWFIKKVPVRLRPAFLKSMRARLSAICAMSDSDFDSFECSFTFMQKEGIELWFAKFMTQYLPFQESWNRDFREWVCSNISVIINKFFTITMEETSRFSGELTTSVFNGLTNVCVHEFLAFKTGQKVVFVVEGDDCLAIWEKQAPTPEDYEALGFSVKIGYHNDLETTSFCGQIFADEDEAVLTDPRYVLAGIGWLPQRYLHARTGVLLSLLRAKAWSCGYQYQGCPILSSLARYLLRVTAGYDARKAFQHLDSYKAELLQEAMANFKPSDPALSKDVGLSSRLLVSELYGISPDVQRRYEAYFDSCTAIQPIPLWFDNAPAPWTECWDDYVRTTANDAFLASHPPELWIPLYPAEVSIPIVPKDRRMAKYIAARIKVVDWSDQDSPPSRARP